MILLFTIRLVAFVNNFVFFMNKNSAKALLQKEIYDVLPDWWISIFENVLSIVKHSKFSNFKKAELFFKTALSHIVVDKDESTIKHLKVKCFNKGTKDEKIYITIEIYFKMKNEDLWNPLQHKEH